MTKRTRKTKGRSKSGGSLRRVLRVVWGLGMLAILLLFALSIAYRLQEQEEEQVVAAGQWHETSESPITVVVLNGCGETGLAGRVRDLMLRDRRFDVVDVDDADDFDYEETLVVDVDGRADPAQEVAAFLKERLNVGRVVRHGMARPPAQVMVILGADLASDRETR